MSDISSQMIGFVPLNEKIENQTVNLSTPTGEVEEGRFDSVSSMADLKEKSPKVYNAMMQGIAINICREMQDHQRRLKKITRKARENNS